MSPADSVKWAAAVIGRDRYKTDLILDSHVLVGDEPVDNGGKDLGPAPDDLLRLSLASCTAITLRMYADRKGMNIDKIEVKVSGEKTESKTVLDCKVLITGDIDEEQRKRILHIAKVCPVHKILTNPIEIVTEVV